jgi:hypothetical protein
VSSSNPSRFAFALPLLATALVLLGQIPGCKTSCDDDEEGDAEVVTTGTTDATRSVYESAPWAGKYLRFRPDKRYSFVHGLRGTPSVVQAWVGFDEQPLSNYPGNISEAAGNEAIIESVTAERVQIRNDTCETFYLRLVASDPIDETSAGGAASAGADGAENTAGASDGGGAGD